MSSNELDYLTRRAERQLQLAQQATHTRVASAHYALASAYLERAAPYLDLDDRRQPNLRPLHWK